MKWQFENIFWITVMILIYGYLFLDAVGIF